MTTKIIRKTLEEAQGLPRAEIDFSDKNLVSGVEGASARSSFDKFKSWHCHTLSSRSCTWRRCPACGT